MEIDSRFTEADQAHREQVVLQESRADWVNVQLTRTFMANTRTALMTAFVSLPVTVMMLWRQVPTAWLILWVVVVGFFTVYRHWVVYAYRKYYIHAGAASLERFFKRHRWGWSVSASVWASLMFLYLGNVPLTNQFICLMILMGMGVFSAILMSARLDCFRPYITSLSFTCMCAVVTSWSKEGILSAQPYDIGLVVLIAIFWWLLMSSGQRFQALQRRGYELQYDNEQLIASLREQTDKAMQAVIVKNSLLANAAHDLRQPVHALAFYADWLRNEPDLAAEVVPKILLATDSVNTLFNSLFDFAKIEAGAVQPQFKAVPVCELVDDLMVQFNHTALEKQIVLRTRIRPAYIWTDPLLIRRIVGNLVANAIRYTEEGGVLIATRIRGNRMLIEVWDTGVGIAPEHQGQVFREFYKASTHKGTEDGFGLGLAIVRRLSDVLGHKVHMHTRFGRGTCMRIEVQLANSEQLQVRLQLEPVTEPTALELAAV